MSTPRANFIGGNWKCVCSLPPNRNSLLWWIFYPLSHLRAEWKQSICCQTRTDPELAFRTSSKYRSLKHTHRSKSPLTLFPSSYFHTRCCGGTPFPPPWLCDCQVEQWNPSLHAKFKPYWSSSALPLLFSTFYLQHPPPPGYGAFTGEQNAEMIKDFGVEWTLAGVFQSPINHKSETVR
jgi:hypothetical protein